MAIRAGASGWRQRDTGPVSATGVVRTWQAEEGWGVIDSPDTPAGCWAHFSSVLVPRYRTLVAGQSVTFDHEVAEQDGYGFRAIEVWPAGQKPDRTSHEITGPSDAYRSSLTTTFDHPDGHGHA
jgi:CspA family cold shock protein